jgi:hypothetical protein
MRALVRTPVVQRQQGVGGARASAAGLGAARRRRCARGARVASVREQLADARGRVGRAPARGARGAQVRFQPIGCRRRGAEPVDRHHQPRHCEWVGVRVREFEPERGAAVTIRFEPEDAIEAADTAECVRRKVMDAVHCFGRRFVGTDSNCDARRGAGVAGSTSGESASPGAHPCRSYVDALSRHRGARPPMGARG